MRHLVRRWDVVLFGALLLIASLPLVLWGITPAALVYSPRLVAQGEWWRILTHPFAHVSRYHLLLDATATLSLLHALAGRRAHERLVLIAASGGASLLAATLVPGETAAYGLCGLSGIGHGLMAAAAALSLREEDAAARRAAAVVLTLVVAKSLAEAVTGRFLLDLVQLGDLGRPNRLCHLGGVIGGALVALALPDGEAKATAGQLAKATEPRRGSPGASPGRFASGCDEAR